ncbi:MAG TPA: hypothetical protein VN957_29320 [Chthoniobacterales bacterium]|nr:hypothetical protein [Chthoniobacterales bacterium]
MRKTQRKALLPRGIKVREPNPIYKPGAKLVKELRDLAWNIRRVRRFRTLLSDPPKEQADGPITVQDIMHEEEHQAKWLEIINDPSAGLQSDVIILLEAIKTGNTGLLQSLLDAIKIYDLELSDPEQWSDNKIAALHVIMACDLFEEECSNKKGLTAVLIRKRAIELWEETRRLSKAPNLKVRELPNVNWSRLFLHDLGIKLRFPPSRLPQGKKQ